jgi:hypothetical protein
MKYHFVTSEARLNYLRRRSSLLNLKPNGESQNTQTDVVEIYRTDHHTIQINHQLDITITPVFYFKFIYSSTYFWRPHAHHQELNNCSSSLWFYLRTVVIAVLLIVVVVVVGPGPNTTNSTAITMLRI